MIPNPFIRDCQRPRQRLVSRVAGAALVLVAVSLWPARSDAQTFDRSLYEQHARECVNNLEFAERALNEGNVDRAVTYIDLAVDPCDVARTMALAGVSSGELRSSQVTALESEIIAQDVRWVLLATQLGLCEEARTMLGETTRLIPDIPSDIQDRYLQASQAVLTCTPGGTAPGPVAGGGPPLNGTVYVGPGMGAQSGSGVAGGPSDANALFGEPCWGSISASPNFHMEVSTGTYVEVTAQSAGDLTIVVSGPGGTFCNDDYEGLNPGIYEWLAAGTYQVWLGEFTQTGTGTPFTASFNANVGSVPAPPTGGAPVYGAVTVGPVHGPVTSSGMAGGPNDANQTFGEPCWGAISAAPSYRLDVTSYGLVSIQATSTGDLTLVVSGPGGTFCNDDYDGLNPAISEQMAAGSYQVYVGEFTRSGTGTAFDIRFSNEPLAPSTGGGPGYPEYGTGGVAATYGTAYVSPGSGMSTLNGVSGGTAVASTRFGGACTGHIADAPDFALEVNAAGTVTVNVTATDGGDTTLVITGPGGTFCNDDTNGLNPAVTSYMTPGTYQVYVGSYWENEYHDVITNFSAY